MKDYYKILEVEENAGPEQIKKSYRSLSMKYHPDKNPDNEDKFKEIVEAYEVLSDENKRRQYDSRKNNPFGGGFQDMDDIFSNMFRGQDFFNQRRRKNAPDKIVKVQVTPIESYLGSDKTIQYVKDYHCETCNGSGGEQQTCRTCNGAGFQVKQFGTGFLIQQVRTTCNTCGGRGYTLVHKCHGCDGKGVKSSVSTINIKLPHGVDNGQYLKVENGGDFRNGDYGDLVIQIELTPKDGFEKINNDLVYNLFLDYTQLMDEKYKIPHPDGEISVTSPKYFDTSKPLKVRGRGYNNGDMYVKLNVKFEKEKIN
jgi:molecular chaperone DnaJ